VANANLGNGLELPDLLFGLPFTEQVVLTVPVSNVTVGITGASAFIDNSSSGMTSVVPSHVPSLLKLADSFCGSPGLFPTPRGPTACNVTPVIALESLTRIVPTLKSSLALELPSGTKLESSLVARWPRELGTERLEALNPLRGAPGKLAAHAGSQAALVFDMPAATYDGRINVSHLAAMTESASVAGSAAAFVHHVSDAKHGSDATFDAAKWLWTKTEKVRDAIGRLITFLKRTAWLSLHDLVTAFAGTVPSGMNSAAHHSAVGPQRGYRGLRGVALCATAAASLWVYSYLTS
jgi:hypothetical protein